jgi:AbrB family looped-hinge helix DNA binding protein
MQNVPNTISNTANREFVSSVSSKGQITLPLEVRKHFDIRDTVIIRVDEGEIKVSPTKGTFSDSFQAIPALKKRLPFEEIRKIAREEHAQEAMQTSE